MRNNAILILLLLLGIFGFSQTPGITWSKRFGGNGNDEIHRIVPIADTGWLVFGTSSSTNGDIGTNKGGTDVWITYWNRLGKIVWKKNVGYSSGDEVADVLYNSDGTFYVLNKSLTGGRYTFHFFKMDLKGNLLFEERYTGAGNTNPVKIIPHTDGFLLVGNTTSYDLPLHHGGTDVYVVRLRFVKITDTDTSTVTKLTKVWDKCLGGSAGDEFFDGATDAAGNFILVSESSSPDGDVGGLHGGGVDIWTVSLSPEGAINWQKCFGGSAHEFYGSFVKTPDNNFVIGARAASTDGDVTGSHFGGDAWVFKIDTSGNFIWKNCFGSAGNEAIYGMVEQNGEVYATAVVTSNGVGGDVSGHHGPHLGNDIWVIKIGVNGNLLWQRCLGGTKQESFVATGQSNLTFRNAIFADSAGGCLIQCYSPSVDGDVTGFHGTVSSTVQDIWLVKLSANGALEWQRCFGGSAREQAGHLSQNGPNNYTFGFSSLSSDGDMNGNSGSQDALLLRLGPVNHIKGSVYVDINKNGIFDVTEKLYPFDIKLQSVKSVDTTISTTSKGRFLIERDSGRYETKVLPEYPYLVPTPSSHISSFNKYFNKDSINFGLQPVTGFKDLVCQIIPLGPARPGMKLSFLMLVGNIGAESVNDIQLKFILDKSLTFQNALPVHSGKLNDTVYWNFPILPAFEEFKLFTINCYVKTPPSVSLGDLTTVSGNIGFKDQDFSPENNSDTVKLVITSSFDPNDKSESHAGKLNISAVTNGEFLDYLIRFQNTGTDTAFNVVIKDTLFDKFDHNSFQMIYASHPYSMAINNNKVASWTFSNINLPDSNRNEVASHGLIAYRIKLKNSVLFGDIIPNSASIYFDFNLPVKTNIQNTLIEVHQPTILLFTPTSGAAGTAVTITGTNFTGATAISFGGTAATSFTVNSSTSITAIVGTGASGNVSVTTPGGTATLAGFTFIPVPTISSYTPTSGGAGASIAITGTNFIGATAVSFGGVAASSFTVNSSTSITAVIGTGASGNVSVITPGGTATLAGFTFIPVPTITSFTPASAGAGSSIMITGTNFIGTTAVSFGGVAAASFTVNSSTSITATVSTGASGNVSVTTAGGTATLAGFTFIPVPTITSFTPASGGIGASITLTGTNLTGATAVSFGGIAATSFTVNSATSITAVVGTGASGNVSITTAGGTATLAGFTFIPHPTISSFTPTSAGAGASITITGTNFTGATAVNFGGVAASSFTLHSATSITAVVGTGASGNVSITTAGGTATLAGFTFIPQPTISSFTPASGATGTSITITGINFTGATAVSFGGVAAASFVINSTTSISAVVGAGASGDITVTTPYGTATAGRFAFEPSQDNNELIIYPNPADEFVQVKHPATELPAQLRVIDLAGKVVKVIIVERNAIETRIDLKGLQQGIYEVVWSDGKNKASQKLMLYK